MYVCMYYDGCTVCMCVHREGVDEVFTLLDSHGVPVVIFSAGVGGEDSEWS